MPKDHQLPSEILFVPSPSSLVPAQAVGELAIGKVADARGGAAATTFDTHTHGLAIFTGQEAERTAGPLLRKLADEGWQHDSVARRVKVYAGDGVANPFAEVLAAMEAGDFDHGRFRDGRIQQLVVCVGNFTVMAYRTALMRSLDMAGMAVERYPMGEPWGMQGIRARTMTLQATAAIRHLAATITPGDASTLAAASARLEQR